MYKNILENIDNLNINQENKKLLMENCLAYVFSWNPFKIKGSEYYKRFVDRSMLIIYKNKRKNLKNIRKKMSSDFYREKINSIGNIGDTDLSVLISGLTDEDIKILLTMKTLNTQIWHDRISTLWANFLAILSLSIVLISTFLKTG
jgi:hypothetical protein